jgi:transposase InsO family protein
LNAIPGRRRPRDHDGQVTTIHSNCRWCADGLEFTCWNGELVRVAFALDCHDREIIGWVATPVGISGDMIRDMMVQCVEKRFGAIRAPHPVRWLSDNGSIFAAHKTIEIALALNLAPCFTPVESPESNGMAEAFVKTFKRDYVRVSLIPNAPAALRSHRRLDRRLQYRAPSLPAGLSFTSGVHPFPTRRVSGLTGSTPSPTFTSAGRAIRWGHDEQEARRRLDAA